MQHIIKRKHWIFDMDGTLTIGVHDFDMMRKELGLAPSAPIIETLQQMPAEQAAPLWEKVNALEFHFASLAKPMPGALALLEGLHARGARLGILTRNLSAVAVQTLTTCGMIDFFAPDVILDRDACAPKPSPAGIHQLLDQWRASAQDTVMVGDYLFDLEAGKAADVATVHIDTSGKFLWPHVSDWLVMHLDEIELV